jgi:predicted membrane-bound spermidine synthase
MTGLLYLFFFLSGLSGLIYQVVWVRVFGNVFGNTIYSASLIVAVFMLGLGVGSYLAGVWSDRRYAMAPGSLLRAYGYFELAIAGLAFGVSILLPHLVQVSALVTSYVREPNGWYVLSESSYASRIAIAVVLLAPITLLMGGTLTLLIRYLVRHDVNIAGWKIAVLYAVNTAGAALGCFLTDFTLVPAVGLRETQMIAVLLNVVAGTGAVYLARSTVSVLGGSKEQDPPSVRKSQDRSSVRKASRSGIPSGLSNAGRRPGPLDPARSANPKSPIPDPGSRISSPGSVIVLTSIALALTGFAAMGMEILWFRHFSILLGAFRAVFSLLLTVILVGIGAGSLISGILVRRVVKPAPSFIVVEALFIVSTLVGLAITDWYSLDLVLKADPAYQAATGLAIGSVPVGTARTFAELWFNTRPILLEVSLPALLMGFAFPLANAIIQRTEQAVGRRAGLLYFANTVGAVCGSMAVGFLLLPRLGIQESATILMIAAGLSMAAIYLGIRASAFESPLVHAGSRVPDPGSRWIAATTALSLVVAAAAVGWWVLLPSNYVTAKALNRPTENERLLTLSEGLNEIITVTEASARGRTLYTNGHPMSSTARFSQRYMRALAHIPLLLMDDPETVLVIGFGVGNTTHAATLHPSIRRVEVADLSRGVLNHASYFTDVNEDVLNDPRVSVFLNDGRHHLQMRPPASYDLITLEPPPIAYAGVASLYSKEFYEVARSRLKPSGYISQWLPVYQVPTTTALAMIRAFVDVFPGAVLLSGAHADLLLIGSSDSRIEVDPVRLAAAQSKAPAVRADMERFDLGSVREIVGTFVGSATMLAEATRETAAASDDRPTQEYGVKSLLNFGDAVPGSVVDLTQLAAWCPKCFVDGRPAPIVEGLDTYLALLDLGYKASPAEVARARALADRDGRQIIGSRYLGSLVPESPELHNVLGISLAERDRLDEAITEFREALRLEPDSAATHWHLGAALASRGGAEEAIQHLRRSVELDPGNRDAERDLATLLTLQQSRQRSRNGTQ